MNEAFDPYKKWLAIPPEEQPPNHYRLLGVPVFEADPDTIENAADQRMMVLRTFQTGKHSALSQRLLNEISAAKVVLLNPQKKTAYDAQLRQQLAPPTPAAKPVLKTRSAHSPAQPKTRSAPAPASVEIATSAPARHQVARRKKPALQNPVVIGGIAGGFLLVLLMVYLIGSRENPPEVADQAKSTNVVEPAKPKPAPVVAKPQPKPEPKDAATPKPNEPMLVAEDPRNQEKPPTNETENPAAAGQPVDLLKLIDPEGDTLSGEWQFEDGALVCAEGSHKQIKIPFEPPSEYDLVVELTRLKGATFGVGLISSNHRFRLAIDGGFGGSGLYFLDGKGYSDNASTYRRRVLQNGKTHLVRCSVRKHGVLVICDGQTIVDWKGNFDRLSIAADDPLNGARCLSLGGHASSALKITKIELIPLRNAESPSNDPEPSPEQVVDLLKRIELQQAQPPGHWRFEEGVLISTNRADVRVAAEYQPPDEYDLRIVATRPGASNKAFAVGLASGGRQFSIVLNENGISGLQQLDGRRWGDNETTLRNKFLPQGEPFTVSIKVRKSGVVAAVNGEAWIDWQGDFARLSAHRNAPEADLYLCTNVSHRISTFELLPFSGESVELDKVEKLAVPGDEAQREAVRKIRQLYEDEFRAATDAAEKIKLARQLIQVAADTQEDSAARFVLLAEARDLAAEGVDAELAVKAVDEIDERYEIDPWPMKAEAVTAAARAAKKNEDRSRVAETAGRLARAALEADRYDDAIQLARTGLGLGQKARAKEYVVSTRQWITQVEAVKEQWDRTEQALQTLADNPDDPEANLALGRFFCLVRGNWETGLPHLANGSDAQLKALAEKDLAEPSDAAAQVEMGDGWWDLGEGEKDLLARKQFHLHAAVWYERALPNLTGLIATKVSSRLDRMAEQYDLWQEMLGLVDPVKHAVAGDWTRVGGELEVAGGARAHRRLVLSELPGDDFDLRVTFTRLTGAEGPFLVLPVGEHQVALLLSVLNPPVSGMNHVDGKGVHQQNPTKVNGSLQNNRRYVLEVAVRVGGERAEVQVRLNGREYTAFQGNAKSLTIDDQYSLPDKAQIALGAYTSAVRFHSVKLRRRSR